MQFLIKVIVLFACIFSFSKTFAQVEIPVEGGRVKLKLDTLTPLPKLINKLNKNWKFIETGKAYWIGYTDDMASIAVHGNDAIPLLIQFVDTAKNYHAREGALYCLHFIGIQQKIVDRFSENFTDKNARNALLYLLRYDEFQPIIVSLLIRDRWNSDVPKIIDVMQNSKSDCWAVVNLSLAYGLTGIPIHQEIPEKFKQGTVRVIGKDFTDEQLQGILYNLKQLKYSDVNIEDTLFHSPLWDYPRRGFSTDRLSNPVSSVSIADFLEDVTDIGYLEHGSRIQYYIKDDSLFICSQSTAKRLLLNWWDNQSMVYKSSFVTDHVDRY